MATILGPRADGRLLHITSLQSAKVHTSRIRKLPSRQNELFRLCWITSPQFHHGNSLLLCNVALVYSVQETVAVLELCACNPILYNARSSGSMCNNTW